MSDKQYEELQGATKPPKPKYRYIIEVSYGTDIALSADSEEEAEDMAWTLHPKASNVSILDIVAIDYPDEV